MSCDDSRLLLYAARDAGPDSAVKWLGPVGKHNINFVQCIMDQLVKTGGVVVQNNSSPGYPLGSFRSGQDAALI